MSVERPIPLSTLRPQSDPLSDQDQLSIGLDTRRLAYFGMQLESDGLRGDASGAADLSLAVIDCYQFSQECLIRAFAAASPRLKVTAFSTLKECIDRTPPKLDLIIYYAHAADVSDAVLTQRIASAHEAFPDIPLIVLSDAEDAHQPKTIRRTLKSGAHGLIPTRTTGIPVAVAAIQFVKAGGTFAPLDLLLTGRSERHSQQTDASRQMRLTARQMTVLSHLQQGKANKIIAHELGMSESTVKVHVRNIMRKMGATNRTQAAYKAQKFWDNAELGQLSEI
ncbi:MAG: response regulator transcription factor [Proteobacteria bacterium]|nr:response regulator transcription factor [Pseudomonadota bacterium]